MIFFSVLIIVHCSVEKIKKAICKLIDSSKARKKIVFLQFL